MLFFELISDMNLNPYHILFINLFLLSANVVSYGIRLHFIVNFKDSLILIFKAFFFLFQIIGMGWLDAIQFCVGATTTYC